MTISIYNKDIQTFHKDGFLLKRSFFSANKCGSLIQELEDYDKSKIINTKEIRSTFLKNRIDNKIPFGGLTYLQKADRACPLIKSFMNRELLKACSKLLKYEDIFFKDNEIHIRQANRSHIIPAHQDNFYFCLKNGLALTCYVYLTEQKRTSGGLGFLKSSTNSPTLNHERSSIEGFSSFNMIKEKISEKYIYPETFPGDVIFHYSQTFHRADPNISERATASISIRAFSSSNIKKDRNLESNYLKNLEFNRN